MDDTKDKKLKSFVSFSNLLDAHSGREERHRDIVAVGNQQYCRKETPGPEVCCILVGKRGQMEK